MNLIAKIKTLPLKKLYTSAAEKLRIYIQDFVASIVPVTDSWMTKMIRPSKT